MRTISEQELKDILDKHGKWLRGDSGGERANLSSANLSSVDLRYANLRCADLRSANLSSADLRYANLSSANGFKFTPLQVVNTKFFITIFDDHVIWGCKKMTFEEVKEFKFSNCKSEWIENEFKLNKKIITEMIRYYRPGTTAEEKL